MTFDTYHWKDYEFNDPELEAARSAVESGDDLDAFLKLLHSSEIAAVGTALDHYAYRESTKRFSGHNPFHSQAHAVLQQARALLAKPPMMRSETGARRDGAEHASALMVLLNLAEPTDSGLIANAMRHARNINVIEAAAMAAGTAMSRTSVPDSDLVDALCATIFDNTRATAERAEALKAFDDVTGPEAAKIAVAAIRSNDSNLLAHGALILATHHFATHRDLIEETIANWPDDASYPAEFVQDALEAAENAETEGEGGNE
ncbi:hypothetical protein [Streptomyces tubercidicus]|uniref:hypothetical protein n=1 Tax=Streptomyces tubercidicus TaxID=47759 RepID=UPI003465FB49